MTRRCSHCSNNGHNSRTCPSRGGGVKLFGVRLTDGSIIKKSASMGNLNLSQSQSQSHHQSPSSSNLAANPTSPCSDHPHDYLSDDPAHASNRRAERKKGVPWSEEEHRLFLIGLQKLGKGDWRGIARNFVVSRTPTQVASHAQKYFIRHTHSTRRKRRSSLFDMLPDHVASSSSDQPSVPEEQVLLPPPPENSQPCNGKSQPSLDLSLKSEFEPMAMETTCQENVQQHTNETMMAPMASHGFFPAYLPVPFPIWPSTAAPPFEEEQLKTLSHSYHHQIHRPIPVIPKEPINFDQLVGMSHLSIGDAQPQPQPQPQPLPDREPSPLSLKLLGEPSRQSAFHANAPVATSDLNNGKDNAIQAV